MAAQGDDLSVPREIDFAIIFPPEDAVLKFALRLLKRGQKVSFSEYEEHDELPWQVLAHPFMEPTHENVPGYEDLLAKEAGLSEGGMTAGDAKSSPECRDE